jgi:3-oxoadipate CoA-transferase alpha subunit
VVNKVCTAAEALEGVRDGAVVAANFWGPGTPCYLWRALFKQGARDLTVCINNYNPTPDVVRETGGPDPTLLLPQTRKIISAYCATRYSDVVDIDMLNERVGEGTIEFENTTHGNLIARLQAGAMRLGGIYSPIGIGTTIESGKEKRVINGVEYIFEEPIVPDLGLVSAARADTLGNLVYHGTARSANPVIAMASRFTVAEVFEIVEPGELDPDTIVTPAAFVDRIVLIPGDNANSREQRLVWLRARREHQLRRVIAAETDAARGDES